MTVFTMQDQTSSPASSSPHLVVIHRKNITDLLRGLWSPYSNVSVQTKIYKLCNWHKTDLVILITDTGGGIYLSREGHFIHVKGFGAL